MIDILKITTKVITVILAMLIIMLIVTMILYKPVYKVSFKENNIGYIDNKTEFVNNLNNYLNQSDDKIAYVHIDELPNYEFFLLKRGNQIDDDSVWEMVKANTVIYSRVYSVNTTDSEVAVFETKEEADRFVLEISTQKVSENVIFTVNESHIFEPQFTNYDEAMQVAQLNYTEKSLSKSSLSSNVNSSSTSKRIINVDVAFASPARGTITSRYGYRERDYHTGIDIANPVGTPIYAAADGKVIFVGTKNGYGNTVIIEHADNMITYYAHCDKMLVNEGDIVSQGKQVATIGLTGRTTGPHVHFEVRINNEAVNPQDYVKNIGQ